MEIKVVMRIGKLEECQKLFVRVFTSNVMWLLKHIVLLKGFRHCLSAY